MSKGEEKMSDSAVFMASPKRETIMSRLKEEGVCRTSVESVISTGSQSENQVVMAVGVSFAERASMTRSQISLKEFMRFTAPFFSMCVN
jgi:hypothetical protein